MEEILNMPRTSKVSNYETVGGVSPSTTMSKRSFQITNKSGLTMLRCTKLTEEFRVFTGRITLSNGAISVDGRSMFELLQLAAVVGTVLTVELVGPDSGLLMQRIAPLLEE